MHKKLRRLNRTLTVKRRQQMRRLRPLGRHPLVAPAAVFLVLVLASLAVWFFVFSPRVKVTPTDETWNVIISHDHEQQIVPSRQPTVGALIKKLGVPIHDGDVVEPAVDTRINQDGFRINIYRAVPVKIVDNGRATFAYSAATTPRSIAKQAGVETYPEDDLTMRPVDNFLQEKALGGVVDITPSIPIRLVLYGTPVPTRTHSKTVGDMLKEKHITLQPGDTVRPAVKTAIAADQQIFVVRKGTKIISEVHETPMPIKIVKDAKLSSGTSAIRQHGSPGAVLVTYQLDKKTGKKYRLQTVRIKAPVTQIVAKGTAPVSGSLATWLRKLRMCESGGNYQTNTGNGFYGAYQFMSSTWDRIAPMAGRSDLVGVRPDKASPADQDRMIVVNTNLSGGGLASQNPGCYYKTGISAFPPGS